MASQFWLDRYNEEKKMYVCPWCSRELKAKVSNSAKNPGKTFVGCSKDYGGCGLFSFLDGVPDDRYKPKDANASEPAQKKSRPAPAAPVQVVGPIAAPPDQTAQRLAELATEVTALRSEIAAISEFIKQVTEN